VRRSVAAAGHGDFRIIHFSVQNDHVHPVAEAENGHALARGVRGLTIRLARAVNRALERRGRVWDSRYHARALTTPRAVRHALVYVLMNFKKHLRPTGTELDPCSSAGWFAGWRAPMAPPTGPPPVARARTWLASIGRRRHGLLAIEERPR